MHINFFWFKNKLNGKLILNFFLAFFKKILNKFVITKSTLIKNINVNLEYADPKAFPPADKVGLKNGLNNFFDQHLFFFRFSLCGTLASRMTKSKSAIDKNPLRRKKPKCGNLIT